MEFNLVINGWQLTFKAKPENGALSSCPRWVFETGFLHFKYRCRQYILRNLDAATFN